MFENQNVAMFVENIYTLAKLYGMKIGEVEDKAGISRGYVSRLKMAEESSNIQDETVKKIADVFGCSAKAILCYDLKNMRKDDLYYFDFVLKLYEDTKHEIVVWDVDDMSHMQLSISEEEYEKCQYKFFYKHNKYRNEKGELVEEYGWISKFLYDAVLDEYAFVDRNMIWSYQIEENIKVLLVGIDIWESESDERYNERYNIQNTNEYHAELYLDKSGKIIPLCASYSNNVLASLLIELWVWLARFGETSIHLTDEIKKVIDGFMDKKPDACGEGIEFKKNNLDIDEGGKYTMEKRYLENKNCLYVKYYEELKEILKRECNFECRVPDHNQYIGFWTIGSGRKKGRFAKIFIRTEGVQITIRKPSNDNLLDGIENTPQKLEFRENVITYRDSCTPTDPTEFAVGIKDDTQLDKILSLLVDSYLQVVYKYK